MDLFENPFHLLNATPRDDKRRIQELADKRDLLLGSDGCAQVRSDLTNPRKRLSMEIAWLPGLGPKRAAEVISVLKSAPADVLTMDGLTAMSRANALAAGLQRLSDSTSDGVAEWILQIAQAFEDVDVRQLCAQVNEDRVVSRFSEVTDLSLVEAEVQERRRHYRGVIKSALDKLSSNDLVEAVTVAVESATDCGEEQGPTLIHDLVDAYEVEAQAFLEKETRNIEALVERLQSAADANSHDSALAPMVSDLIQVVRNWDIVAQPIQVSAMSRGMKHVASHDVAILVRELAVHLFNNHGRLDLSRQLTSMLQEVFAEVVEVAETAAEDVSALAEIAARSETTRQEITYEANIGGLFKSRFRISPEGVEWKGKHWRLDSIDRTRWGGTRQYVNGIPTGTTYSIVLGTTSDVISIDFGSEEAFTNIVDRVWRTVGVRLMTEFLTGLRQGKTFPFYSVVVSDTGLALLRAKLFSSKCDVSFCPWDELLISNGPGFFCVSEKREKGFSAHLSYLEVDNVHVLEAALRTFMKRPANRLSSLLGEQG
jgi:hypothetical protein